MECLIDSRENIMIEKLKVENSFPFSQKMLSTGDIHLISGEQKLIIERKTWNDLRASLRDNRFREQRSRLLMEAKDSRIKLCYLIEGIYNNSFLIEKKALFRLQFAYNIPVIYSKSVLNTIEIIDTWIKLKTLDSYFVQRNIEIDQVESRLRKSIKKNFDDPSIFFQETLASIKGITPIIAHEIANTWNSFSDFFQNYFNDFDNWNQKLNSIQYKTKQNNSKKINKNLIERIKINLNLLDNVSQMHHRNDSLLKQDEDDSLLKLKEEDRDHDELVKVNQLHQDHEQDGP